MADCLIHHSRANSDSSMKSGRRLSSVNILEVLSGSNELVEQVIALQHIDSLCNWFHQKSDVSSRMLARIQNLANLACSKVKWSFLIEPGRPQTDLSVLLF